MPSVEIDYSACIYCKTCVSTCPMGVYEDRGDQVAVHAPEECIACMGCVAACPAQCITVVE
jgi:NAD-dependent dihydropyrimidine dehydrogenase PreA subunit